ncbi:Myosin-like protein, partial [Phytophthora palmivora]
MMAEDGASLASPDSGGFPLRRRSFLFLLMRKAPILPPFRSRRPINLSFDCTTIGTRVEAEKRELIDKLKQAVGAGKAMKKQLDDARTHNKTQQQELELKDHEKQELVLKLEHAVARSQAMQQQLEDKDGELEVALSKVEAFQVELQAQQETHDKIQIKWTQEEARVMVFQEEKNRLTHQVAAMLEERQQQEREIQDVVQENDALQRKVQDLMQQVTGARQQQEDTEQMYLEVASKLNQALRDNDELTQGRRGSNEQELVMKIQMVEAELAASTEKWEKEKQQLTQQIQALTTSNEKISTELAEVAEIREQLLVHVGIDLTYESIESLLDTKSNEIRMLTEQLAAAEAPQEQAIREAVSTAIAEAERLSTQLETLQTQYDSLAAEKSVQDKTVEELRTDLERVAEEHSSSLFAKEDERRRLCEEKQMKIEQLTAQLDETQTQKQLLTQDFSTIRSKVEDMIAALPVGRPELGIETSQNSRFVELEAYLEHIHKQLTSAAKPDLGHIESETKNLQERIHKYEEENRLLVEKLEECEAALKARASDIEKFANRGLEGSSDSEKWVSSGEYAGSVASNGETAESCNGDASDLEHELEITKAQLHAVEAEMTACKAENLRMIFEVAKTADGVSKLKQDHETLLVTHQEKSSELDSVIVQLEALQSANQKLESDLKSKSDDLQHHLEVSGMQKEDFQSVIDNLNSVVVKAAKENSKIKRDLEDIKTENDVLEERISELHAVTDSKTEPDESQEKDREVEELRSSLVQAKVNFLEQKQQLTALEKKLVEVSKSSGPTCTVNSASLDAERREFEAALIEMIEMEKKLQVAYEAKQGLESTLQERMVAKAELEDRLSIAEDKIAELEQQLEQKVALIATIEEQLRSVEEEREKLADEFAKTKSKLERSRGKLEEKAIEFEAFKTTTNMLKDERSRLFNEIAMLKDKIAKSEVQKAAMADSQELANEELEEQLNELADKIAEIETEKQELRARLEETVYRSEEDIHQLRERLYMLEEEKSGIDDENLKLERTIENLESKLNSLEEQKAELEAANESSSEQLNHLEERVEKATSEIATLSGEKNSMIELQHSLEENVFALQDEKVKLEHTLEETTFKLQQELELVTAQVEAIQGQLLQSAAEKDEISAELSELQERVQADKLAHEEVAGKLESQIAENETLENKISVLKQMAERALQSLQANRDELAEAESRADVLTEERDAVKALLHEKQSAYEELTAQRDALQQQVEKLRNELENLLQKHSEETGAAEETIRGLKETESTLTKSLESVKQDLAEAESCVMVLVEERDAARKELTAKDLKIEVMLSQQGELDLAAQNLEKELKTLRSKSAADAEATEEMIRDLKEAKTQAEDTARILNDSSAQAEESLRAIQEKLAESELRVITLEKERDATRTSLNEKESTQETLSALQEDLQNKVAALETELKELSKTSSTELAAANETIAHLKNAEAEKVETLASLRQELAEAEGCVMVLVEERDDAKKTLSKKDLTLEVLSSEHGELQLKNQSVTTELEALRNKSAVDAQAAEEMVETLKEEVRRATESLESTQKELLESETRVAVLNAECDGANKALNDFETELKCLSTQKEDLQKRIERQEVDIVSLQSQHSAELASAEKTISAMKTSESEMTSLLQSVRQEMSNLKDHADSLSEEHNAAKIALAEQQVTINSFKSEVAILNERIQSLEGELQELQSQREVETQTAEETIRSLKESESQTAETLEAIRQQLSETEARVVSAEEEREAASKAVSEMESHREAQSTEVESLQERIQSLEGELQELQSQREREVETQTAEETIRSLKESESQTA